MRKFLLVAAVAALGSLGLSACQKHDNANESSASAKVTRPTTADVDAAMKTCQAKNPTKPAPAASGTAGAAAGAAADDDTCNRASIAASTWQPYLQQVVQDNTGTATSGLYAYFVPSPKYPENQGSISRVQEQLDGVIQATVLPGNLVAAGGPDSAATAQVLETAFKTASPGSFKGVVVLFIGDQADEAAVKAAVDPSGASFKFVQM